MERILVKASKHSYPIFIGENIRFRLNKLIEKKYSSILIVSDEKVAELYVNDIVTNFPDEKVFQSIIPVGEQSKRLEYYYQLQTDAIQFGLDRESLIIALGGGVVGDLAGFAAATYMRGIDYIQMPTTILAHDSSVGGKVAINHELGKNLIGSFYPPAAVVYDTQSLETLSEKDIRSGYAELVKEALIADEVFFNKLLNVNLINVKNNQLEEHLSAGIKIKSSVVEIDEQESGVRKNLNLGHTLGHALEAELGYGEITHGEAVAIGLLFSLHVSESTFSSKLPYDSTFQWLKKNNYPLNILQLNEDSIIKKMKTDKKTLNNTIQMVLLKEIGKPIVQEINDYDMKIYLKSFTKKLEIASLVE
ncbi:3-dehydroquinate synthase [Virgibacillus natechei]|uniref:3-dehydroquinate synthase n=1 Tax=Virgibacillus natechei TaxID=1216297 RepID=A0ABS4IF80_9BACI|nr:3-dehydroquinate synthase [Virgibacillus natechei]MBP1969607.1 3-dehydroquinate synthase [Virgibacillus natechei]UZD11338.1 3-dehydroquinate synthase [Virgibacillus natechei]